MYSSIAFSNSSNVSNYLSVMYFLLKNNKIVYGLFYQFIAYNFNKYLKNKIKKVRTVLHLLKITQLKKVKIINLQQYSYFKLKTNKFKIYL